MARPSMSQREMKRWQQRLSEMDKLWARHGLVSRSVGVGRDVYGAQGEDIHRYLRGYRGDPWDGTWGGIDETQLAVTTLCFSVVNSWLAGLQSRNPRTQLFPRLRSGTRHATEIASDAIRVEGIINYDIAHMNMKREFSYTLFDAFFSPAGGFTQHGFTPADEFEIANKKKTRLEPFAMVEPDRPWVRAVKPWDIRVDPLARSFHSDDDAEYVAFRQLRTLDDIKANPGLVAYDGLVPTISYQYDTGTRENKRKRGDEGEGYVESWLIYERRERTCFEITMDGKQPLRERNDWPIPWRNLPYNCLQFNEQRDTPFQVPYMSAIWQALCERNKLRTLMMELVKRMRRLIAVNINGLAEGEEKKLFRFDGPDLTEFIKVTGAINEVIGQFQVGGLDASVMALDGLYVNDVREAIGQSQFSRGQRANVETANESQAIQAGEAVVKGRNQDCYETYLKHTLRAYLTGRQWTTDEAELVPLLGVEDARLLQDNVGMSWFSVTPEQLRREYDLEIVAGSTLPRNRQQEVAMATADLNLAGQNQLFAPLNNIRQLVINYWLARGVNPQSVMMTDKQIGATNEVQGMAGMPAEDQASGDLTNQVRLFMGLNGSGGAQ